MRPFVCVFVWVPVSALPVRVCAHVLRRIPFTHPDNHDDDDSGNLPAALPTPISSRFYKITTKIKPTTTNEKKVPVAGSDDRLLERGRGRVHPHGGEASARFGRPRHLGWHHGHVRRSLLGGGLESHGSQAGALLGVATSQERLRIEHEPEVRRAPKLARPALTTKDMSLLAHRGLDWMRAFFGWFPLTALERGEAGGNVVDGWQPEPDRGFVVRVVPVLFLLSLGVCVCALRDSFSPSGWRKTIHIRKGFMQVSPRAVSEVNGMGRCAQAGFPALLEGGIERGLQSWRRGLVCCLRAETPNHRSALIVVAVFRFGFLL